jgi:hypothetical protein
VVFKAMRKQKNQSCFNTTLKPTSKKMKVERGKKNGQNQFIQFINYNV